MTDLAAPTAAPIWTLKRDSSIEPADIAKLIGIAGTMTLHDLCTAFDVSPCETNYDKIRKTVPQANQGRVSTFVRGIPVYLWRMVNGDEGTFRETIRCIEVP